MCAFLYWFFIFLHIYIPERNSNTYIFWMKLNALYNTHVLKRLMNINPFVIIVCMLWYIAKIDFCIFNKYHYLIAFHLYDLVMRIVASIFFYRLKPLTVSIMCILNHPLMLLSGLENIQ